MTGLTLIAIELISTGDRAELLHESTQLGLPLRQVGAVTQSLTEGLTLVMDPCRHQGAGQVEGECAVGEALALKQYEVEVVEVPARVAETAPVAVGPAEEMQWDIIVQGGMDGAAGDSTVPEDQYRFQLAPGKIMTAGCLGEYAQPTLALGDQGIVEQAEPLAFIGLCVGGWRGRGVGEPVAVLGVGLADGWHGRVAGRWHGRNNLRAGGQRLRFGGVG